MHAPASADNIAGISCSIRGESSRGEWGNAPSVPYAGCLFALGSVLLESIDVVTDFELYDVPAGEAFLGIVVAGWNTTGPRFSVFGVGGEGVNGIAISYEWERFPYALAGHGSSLE